MRPVDEVEEREQENPDDVDEVPVETRHFNRGVPLRREAVARRHDPVPAVIIIDAQRAHADGIRFYQSGPLFLAENVPAKFLSLK